MKFYCLIIGIEVLLAASAYTPSLEAGIISSGMKPNLDASRLAVGSLEGFISGNRLASLGKTGDNKKKIKIFVGGRQYDSFEEYKLERLKYTKIFFELQNTLRAYREAYAEFVNSNTRNSKMKIIIIESKQ